MTKFILSVKIVCYFMIFLLDYFYKIFRGECGAIVNCFVGGVVIAGIGHGC